VWIVDRTDAGEQDDIQQDGAKPHRHHLTQK